MSKSNEAFWWSLFSTGGVAAALFVPAIVMTTGFLLPTTDVDLATNRFKQLHDVVSLWPVRIVLFMVLFLSFFHCAHRVRHTLMDLGLRRLERWLMSFCYAGALAGTIVAATVLARL